MQIQVFDQMAKITSNDQLPIFETPSLKSNGRRIGFSRVRFIYDAQVFNSTYERKSIVVEPYSTKKVETRVEQT